MIYIALKLWKKYNAKNVDIRKEWDLKILVTSKNEIAHLFHLFDLHQKKRKNFYKKRFSLKVFFSLVNISILLCNIYSFLN